MADEPSNTGRNQNDNMPPHPTDSDDPHGRESSMDADPFNDPDQLFDDPEEESATEEGPFDPAEVLSAQVDEMERQQADLADRLAKAQEEIHRYQAEIQNLHRRREKETEETSKYAIAKFAKDIVEVSDNFERAMSSVPADATHDNPVLKSLLDGVTMTERAFLGVLEKHSVIRISPKDELFDPHQHQAVMEQEDKAVPAGTVLQVYQAGYMISDRVLRPAMVVVARGGPKPVKPVPATDPEAEAGATDQADPSETSNGTNAENSAPDQGTDQT